MYWDNFNAKNVGIWGMGKEGEAAYNALNRFTNPQNIFILDDAHLDHLKKCDIIIKSPGVSLYRPEIQEAQKQGIIFTSGSSLFMANKPKQTRVIGVTGTKGKSTTSSLIYHTLQTAGKNVKFGGNIGQPLLNLLQEDMPDFIVAELSSYQCADFKGSCDYAVLTNFFPEHLQWHGSHARYYADKCQMLQQAKIVFVNKNNPTVQAHLNRLPNARFFNTPDTFHLEQGYFYAGPLPLFDQKTLNLMGDHNAENACAVLSIAHQLKIDLASVQQAFSTFQALPHRLQPVGNYQGLTFIDDSISTTPETTIAAIKALDKGQPMSVLVGGYDRGQDFQTLINFLSGFDKRIHLITLPETGTRAYTLAQKANIPATRAQNIPEAVRIAYQLTPAGGCVLLSPGSPSYNLYKNFEERGADFQNQAQKINTEIILKQMNIQKKYY